MRSQKTFLGNIGVNILVTSMVTGIFTLASGGVSLAQSAQYSRKKPAASKDATSTPATPDASSSTAAGTAATPAAAPAPQGDKLDINDLEQKYWAPKDTDFSVVQNRTYTKAKRHAFSVLVGELVDDPYNQGFSYELKYNYYFDERMGVELFYNKADERDSKSTKDFQNLSLGGIRPDFNRDVDFLGIGFNWVPFYAKMSFLGKKIIYFDMQITPFIGFERYKQLEYDLASDPTKTAFAYGFDIVQYFFFSNHWAVQADLQNRYYQQEVVSYGSTSIPNSGGVSRRNDTGNTTNFLLGVTYFF